MNERQVAAKFLSFADKYARAEIRRLKRLLKAQRQEGMQLFHKYSFGGLGPRGDTCGLPHEIEDFLQGLGDG